MELKSITKKEEPLLERVRVESVFSFENATPSYQDIAKHISGSLKVEENRIVLRNVYTLFGARKAKVIAYIYRDESAKKSTEPKAKSEKSKDGKKEASK